MTETLIAVGGATRRNPTWNVQAAGITAVRLNVVTYVRPVCKCTKPWKLPDIRGQGPPVPAEPAAPPLDAAAASDAPPPEAAAASEAPTAKQTARLRAPRPGSRAGPTAGAISRDIA
eukprot:109274-Pyramimonas_sp.AAC.1